MIFINFKTYKEATGDNAIVLANTMLSVREETGVEMIACPQTVDLKDINDFLPGKTWAQHVDVKERGRATGWFPPQVAKDLGAYGTLLNHSEHKLSDKVLRETIDMCKKVDLKTLVFAAGVKEAEEVAKLGPDFIGYEPPELIASPDTSVARAKPGVIEKVVKKIKDIPILVGAGVKDKRDVEVSLKLGAIGVLLASAVILSDNPKSVLTNLASGFKK